MFWNLEKNYNVLNMDIRRVGRSLISEIRHQGHSSCAWNGFLKILTKTPRKALKGIKHPTNIEYWAFGNWDFINLVLKEDTCYLYLLDIDLRRRSNPRILKFGMGVTNSVLLRWHKTTGYRKFVLMNFEI